METSLFIIGLEKEGRKSMFNDPCILNKYIKYLLLFTVLFAIDEKGEIEKA